MFSADKRSRRMAALLAPAALLLPVAAEAAIVVASSGPSASAYPAGRKLDDAGSVTLRAGDTVTVLDAKGTRVLRGEGTFAVAAGPGAAPKSSTFAVLTMQRSAQRVRTGAVRAGKDGTPPASPNLWFVDLAKPGKRCLVAGQPVRFWRLDTAAPATYTLTAPGGPGVPLTFALGAMVAPWDSAKYPLASGSTLHVALGGKAVGTVSFAVLPSQPATAEAMAAALIEQGCTTQLELLSTTLAQP